MDEGSLVIGMLVYKRVSHGGGRESVMTYYYYYWYMTFDLDLVFFFYMKKHIRIYTFGVVFRG